MSHENEAGPNLEAWCAGAAEPVIAGTLCLMSAVMHSGCPRAMLRIERNLDLLSRHPGVSAEFQTVASRLSRQWRARALGLLACAPTIGPASEIH